LRLWRSTTMTLTPNSTDTLDSSSRPDGNAPLERQHPRSQKFWWDAETR
jgi:hypothetical protein